MPGLAARIGGAAFSRSARATSEAPLTGADVAPTRSVPAGWAALDAGAAARTAPGADALAPATPGAGVAGRTASDAAVRPVACAAPEVMPPGAAGCAGAAGRDGVFDTDPGPSSAPVGAGFPDSGPTFFGLAPAVGAGVRTDVAGVVGVARFADAAEGSSTVDDAVGRVGAGVPARGAGRVSRAATGAGLTPAVFDGFMARPTRPESARVRPVATQPGAVGLPNKAFLGAPEAGRAAAPPAADDEAGGSEARETLLLGTVSPVPPPRLWPAAKAGEADTV
jgi:hypothetical protein